MLRVTQERKKLGISQAELSRRIGANPASLCRIEKGTEPPYRLRAQRIANALNWNGDPMELFQEVEEGQC